MGIAMPSYQKWGIMLDLTHLPASEYKTARKIENILYYTWLGDDMPRSITVHQSFLLEALASTVVSSVKIKRVGLRGRRTRLTGDPLALQGIMKMYMSTVLGSERIA